MTALRALLVLAGAANVVAQPAAGQFEHVGSTLVSGMMMFLGNDEKVYIMDKVEGNAVQVNGHPAWASVWDIATRKATPMDFSSNSFCASGMHLPNGTFATFGGNAAVGIGATTSSDFNATYDDYDGRKAIRLLQPCTGDSSAFAAQCQWFDNATQLSMVKRRWYSTAEPRADGTVAIIGGFVSGGYINRNWPNVDPDEGDVSKGYNGAENTYEFFPSPDGQAPSMPFMRNTSGLNSYPHTFLMPSGKMYMQANFSTILWDPTSGAEEYLPDTPGHVVRVYPASGAVAMLPLTPANNYNPTILLCGGQSSASMDDYAWGDYSFPFADTWNIPATADCQRITPEPTDGSSPAYTQDDDMLEGRTMGQFITLPTGQLLVINGALNGTAGYSNIGVNTSDASTWGEMPFGMSLASGPVLTPALYDPSAPAGSRWSRTGFGAAQYPRLYHSSALLLPDASVLVAGSNPNVDVNLTTAFPTTYDAEIFYPPYYFHPRPVPAGLPTSISYGGPSFDITLPSSSYSGSANAAAANASVVLLRPGWTTHAMNMGQRMLQLNNTYTVNADGSIVLHTAQHPPNANLVTPGPALLFVVVNGVPSNGTTVTVGNGKLGTQPTQAAAALPPSVQNAAATGAASATSGAPTPSSTGAKGKNSARRLTDMGGALVGAFILSWAALLLL